MERNWTEEEKKNFKQEHLHFMYGFFKIILVTMKIRFILFF